MKSRILSLLPLVVCFAIVPAWAQENFTIAIPEGFANPGKLFIVKNAADTPDAKPGDNICADASGNCTLRAAVDETNANSAVGDVIIFELAYPSVIELTGPLTVNEHATSIVGPGARRLTIRRAPSAPSPFRIFHIPNSGTLATIRGLRIENGVAGNFISGGALRIGPGATADLIDVWMEGNSAGSGGAISNEGTLSIFRSLITGNAANVEGGALHLALGSDTVIANSTITSNSAANGGAIYSRGTLVSVNNTISHNSATSTASSIASASGSNIRVLNTIIGADPSLPVSTIAGSFDSLGNNLVTDARTATGFTNGVNNDQVSDNNAIDPQLGPLADNGGQTDTRALLTSSPAIDHGNSCVSLGQGPCPGLESIELLRSFLWDQRVPYSRWRSSSVDVGAFENAGVPSGGSFFSASFTFSGWPLNRAGNAMAINAVTGQRRYATLNLVGGFRLRGLETPDIHIIEIRLKNWRLSPMVIPRGF